VLAGEADPSEAARQLVDAANSHGGSDNITVVVVDVLVGEEPAGTTTVVTPLNLPATVLPLADADDPDPTTTVTVGGAAEGGAAEGGAAEGGAAEGGAAEDGAAEEGNQPKTGREGEVAGSPPGASPTPSAAAAHAAEVGAITTMVPAIDDTLAPGSRLGFDADTSLAESGPNSDEFFLGSLGSTPVARASARVPLAPSEREPVKRKENESRRARRRRLGIPRRVTPRVVLFVLLVAAVPVAAYYVLRWYAYDNWTVTLHGDQIVVVQGQPGGVLWFKPRVVDRTGVSTSQILPPAVAAIGGGVQESSLANARDYVQNLVQQFDQQHTPAPTTTTTTAPSGAVTTTTPPSPGTPAP
jgi:hypothetical protein